MWTWIIAAPAASHSRAVATSSSRVVGSWGQSALVVSAPVGATVTRRASDGTVMAPSCQRACGSTLLPLGVTVLGEDADGEHEQRGAEEGAEGVGDDVTAGAGAGGQDEALDHLDREARAEAERGPVRDSQASEEEPADEAEGHEHHDVEGELDLGGVER